MRRVLPLLLLPFLAVPCAAQTLHAGASAAGMLVHVDPIDAGAARSGAYLTQPVLVADASAAGGTLSLHAMVNLEGLTLADGELAPGAWGEGFIDKRHPHTYLHELVATVSAPPLAGFEATVTVGKGFVPFGTDDPMSRPVVRYPVNHHFAQILERAVAILAVRRGPAAIEAAVFNGDEPEEPSSWPNLERFGDSWGGRITVWPGAGIEGQLSRAVVASPEHREGAGSTQGKWSASARWDGAVAARPVTVLGEIARTSEADGFFVYRSVLAEGAWTEGGQRLHYRFERTERPEEERQTDPFRSVRPHHDDSNLGTTRWTVHTLGLTARLPSPGGYRLSGLAEVSRAGVRRLSGVVIDPAAFYGATAIWSVSVGLRLELGAPMHRMGRYGAASPTDGGGQRHLHP